MPKPRRISRRTRTATEGQMMMAVGTFIVQWGPSMPDDLVERWEIAERSMGERFHTDELLIRSNSRVTELQCVACYGPWMFTGPSDLRRQFEQQLAVMCANVGATSFAAVDVRYKTRDSDFEVMPSRLGEFEKFERVISTLGHLVDDIDTPLSTRKQYDALAALVMRLLDEQKAEQAA